MLVIRAIKFLIIALLSVLYWPLNTAFLYLQKNYRRWQKDDMVSFIIATPLYYLFFVVVAILSIPLEVMGDKMHPPIGGFR